MVDVLPFAAWYYNTPSRIKPADVLTEPYDKIAPAMQVSYYARSPHNFVRIELGRDEPGDDQSRNKYTRAAEFLNAWREEKVLIQHPQSTFYLYRQRFQWPLGQWHTRNAIIGRVRLSPFSEGQILPHENTLAQPKEDRLRLLRTTQAYTGQIFLLYDGENNITRPQPNAVSLLFEFTDEKSIQHRLEAIEDPSTVEAFRIAFRDTTLYVADGHHRYETALTYRDERRRTERKANPEASYEFVMAALVDWRDPELIILPTHRLIKNVPNFNGEKFRERLLEIFQMERHADLGLLLEHLERAPAGAHWYGMFLLPNHFWLLRLRTNSELAAKFANQPPLWENIDTAILQTMILEPLLGINELRLREETNIEYDRQADVVEQKMIRGEGQIAFFLNPTPIKQVIAVADAHSRMPPKSTDFYPKFPSGLTLYDVSGK